MVHLWPTTASRVASFRCFDSGRSLGKSHPGRVEFIFLSETFSSTEMNRFLNDEAAQMPKTPSL